MFDRISIIDVKRVHTVTVVDDGSIIHRGNRPVDYNFARRVSDFLVEKGYTPIQQGNATIFRKE